MKCYKKILEDIVIIQSVIFISSQKLDNKHLALCKQV